MLKRILLTLIALSLMFFGGLIVFMGYLLNNPEKIVTSLKFMTEKFAINESAYEENEEFFLQGVTNLKFEVQKSDLNIKTYPGSTLKVQVHGIVPSFEKGPFLIQDLQKETLTIHLNEPAPSHWVDLNINGKEMTEKSNSKLQVDIYIPEVFVGEQFYKTISGKVLLQLADTKIYEFDLQSKEGSIENLLKQKPTSATNLQEVGHIKVQTINGSIAIKPL